MFDGVRREAAREPAITALVRESRLRVEEEAACDGLRPYIDNLVGDGEDLLVDC